MSKSIGDLMGVLDLRLQLHNALKRNDEPEIKRLEGLIYEFTKDDVKDEGNAPNGGEPR